LKFVCVVVWTFTAKKNSSFATAGKQNPSFYAVRHLSFLDITISIVRYQWTKIYWNLLGGQLIKIWWVVAYPRPQGKKPWVISSSKDIDSLRQTMWSKKLSFDFPKTVFSSIFKVAPCKIIILCFPWSNATSGRWIRYELIWNYEFCACELVKSENIVFVVEWRRWIISP